MHPASPLWCSSGDLNQACLGVSPMLVQRCIWGASPTYAPLINFRKSMRIEHPSWDEGGEDGDVVHVNTPAMVHSLILTMSRLVSLYSGGGRIRSPVVYPFIVVEGLFSGHPRARTFF